MLRVMLVQRHRQLFAGTAAQVILPSQAGEVTVLDFHAPMLCALGEGTIHVDEARFPVRGGVARVDRNRVTIVAR